MWVFFFIKDSNNIDRIKKISNHNLNIIRFYLVDTRIIFIEMHVYIMYTCVFGLFYIFYLRG